MTHIVREVDRPASSKFNNLLNKITKKYFPFK
jgi:hypothetical protein